MQPTGLQNSESRKAANNQDTVKEEAVEEPDPPLIFFPPFIFVRIELPSEIKAGGRSQALGRLDIPLSELNGVRTRTKASVQHHHMEPTS